MALIQHRKIANLLPEWAPFHGFSLLFDNPGKSLLSLPNGVDRLHNDPAAAPGQELFQLLGTWISDTGKAHLMNAYGFCPLPVESYHVTVWDGISDQEAGQVASPQREHVTNFLRSLPDSLAIRQSFLEGVSERALLSSLSWTLTFRFSRLTFWKQRGLAAALEPADDTSAHLLEQLTAGRSTLSSAFSSRLHFQHDAGEYVPHITLGYFVNEQLASGISPHVEIRHWTEQLQERLAGITLTFHSLGVYAFTDMASYFRVKKSTPMI